MPRKLGKAWGHPWSLTYDSAHRCPSFPGCAGAASLTAGFLITIEMGKQAASRWPMRSTGGQVSSWALTNALLDAHLAEATPRQSQISPTGTD